MLYKVISYCNIIVFYLIAIFLNLYLTIFLYFIFNFSWTRTFHIFCIIQTLQRYFFLLQTKKFFALDNFHIF